MTRRHGGAGPAAVVGLRPPVGRVRPPVARAARPLLFRVRVHGVTLHGDRRDVPLLRVARLVGLGIALVGVDAGRVQLHGLDVLDHLGCRAVAGRGRGHGLVGAVVRRQFGEVLQQDLALAVDVADRDERGVRAELVQQLGHELLGVASVAAEVDGARAELGGDGVDGGLGRVADDEDALGVEGGDDLAHLPIAFDAVGTAVDDHVERAVDGPEVEQLVDVHQRRLGVVGREDVGEAQFLAPGRQIALDGEDTGVRRSVVHALQGRLPVDAEKFGDGQRDGHVLLEGEPAEAAQLLVADRLRVGVDQPAVPGIRLLLEDVEAVLLGGDADAVLGHRAAQ